MPPQPEEPPPAELWSAVGDIRPWSTHLLLLSWIAVFGTMALRGSLDDHDALILWGANATDLGPGSSWRLLASTFIHAGLAHLFFNGLSLLLYGPAVERVFTRWGFWLVYACGGAGASFASLAWRASRGGPPSLSVGASGAIFALGGAMLAGAVRLRHRLAPGRARAMGAAFLFLLAPGLVAGLSRVGTDNVAHAAGLACGLLLGALLPLGPRLAGPSTPLPERVLGAAAALALVSALARGIAGGLGLR
jgi:rhomboid protease GluP